jgi:MYXO-CTERM domain-containing protein
MKEKRIMSMPRNTTALIVLLGLGAWVLPAQAYQELVKYNFDTSYIVGEPGSEELWTPDIAEGSPAYDGVWKSGGDHDREFLEDDPFTQQGNLSAKLVSNTGGYDCVKPAHEKWSPLVEIDLSYGGLYNAFTVEAWVKLDGPLTSQPDDHRLWNGQSQYYRDAFELGVFTGDNPEKNINVCQHGDFYNQAGGNIQLAGTVPPGQWVHVAYVYDGDTNSASVIINGDDKDNGGSQATRAGYLVDGNTGVPLASVDISEWWPMSTLQFGLNWNGLIDDARICSGIVPEEELGYFASFSDLGDPLDLNGDGVVDAADIDHLWSNPEDRDGDGTADGDDVVYYVSQELGTLMGDSNLDGNVDEADLAFLADGWKVGPGYDWSTGDFTGNGEIDEADLAYLADNWKQPGGSPVTALPEPATMTLLGLGGLVALRRRR